MHTCQTCMPYLLRYYIGHTHTHTLKNLQQSLGSYLWSNEARRSYSFVDGDDTHVLLLQWHGLRNTSTIID